MYPHAQFSHALAKRFADESTFFDSFGDRVECPKAKDGFLDTAAIIFANGAKILLEDRYGRAIHFTSYDHEGDVYREEDYAPLLDTESDQEWHERMYSEIEDEALLAWENVQELLFL